DGRRNPRAASRAIVRSDAAPSHAIRQITLQFQPLAIFGLRGKNRLQRRLTRVYSHLTDWDPGELVEIRWNRNISSGRAAAHSSVIEPSPLPILPVSRPRAATEQRPRRSEPPSGTVLTRIPGSCWVPGSRPISHRGRALGGVTLPPRRR